EFEEVRDAPGLLEGLVETFARTDDTQVLPKLFAQSWDQLQSLLESTFVARHAAVVPNDLAKLAMKRIRRAFTADAQEPFGAGFDFGQRCFDLRVVVRYGR